MSVSPLLLSQMVEQAASLALDGDSPSVYPKIQKVLGGRRDGKFEDATRLSVERALAIGAQYQIEKILEHDSLRSGWANRGLREIFRGRSSPNLVWITHSFWPDLRLQRLLEGSLEFSIPRLALVSEAYPQPLLAANTTPVLPIYSHWGEIRFPVNADRIHFTGGDMLDCLMRSFRQAATSALLWRHRREFTAIFHSSAIYSPCFFQDGGLRDFSMGVQEAWANRDVPLARKIMSPLITRPQLMTRSPIIRPNYFLPNDEFRWMPSENPGFEFILTRRNDGKRLRLEFLVN